MELGLFKSIVSLGISCQPAHQIGRIFPGHPSQVLDWVLPPEHTLAELLKSGFDGFFTRERLIRGYRDRIEDSRYRVQFFHEFPNESNFDEKYAEHAPRFKELVKRWHTVVSGEGPILFIRQSSRDDSAQKYALSLLQTLKECVLRAPFTLLYLTPPTSPPFYTNQPGLLVRPLPQSEPRLWTGNDAAWESLLKEGLQSSPYMPQAFSP